MRLDVVVPVYNEAPGLHAFHAELTSVLRGISADSRIIYVNDGSSDDTAAVLNELEHPETVRIIELSRNFGHQAALSAGLEAADADIVVSLDGDGQHPPDLIPDMIALYRQGYDIVQTQRLDEGSSEGLFKRLTSSLFYQAINRAGDLHIAPGSADFRLISMAVVRSLRSLPEYHRFIRGMVCWIGFRTVLLPYMPRQRAAGVSKYSLIKMIRFAADGIFSFSLMPLRLGIFIGCAFLLFALFEICYVLGLWFTNQASRLVPGWSSTIIVLTVATGVIMVLLGIIGVYIGMIFQEVKRRPVYIVRSDTGVSTRDV